MRYFSFLFFGLVLLSCQPGDSQNNTDPPPGDSNPVVIDTPAPPPPPPLPDTTALERTLLAQGLQDIQTVDSSIQVQMMYSTPENFLEQDVYGEFDACYLQPVVARMLAVAQDSVQAQDPHLSLLVFDCVRPRSVQKQMWEIVKGTPQQPYVAAPGGGGSMHNYGAAVDLGLVHRDTGLVDMGTPFDFFGDLAQPRYEMKFKEAGQLTTAQLQNRWLLRRAMRSAGFHMIMSEWWHFNGFSREETRQRFQIVE